MPHHPSNPLAPRPHTPRPEAGGSCPLPASAAVDRYFLEARGKLLEIAATLDRWDRCQEAQLARSDYRAVALREAIALLARTAPGLTADRVRQLLLLLSDHSLTPIPSAADGKAFGAPKPPDQSTSA